MHPSQVRPESIGRKLVAQQQAKQHHPASRSSRRAIDSVISFLKFSFSNFANLKISALSLMTVCMALISGCGGLTYKSLGTTTGSSQGNGVVLSQISCDAQSLTGAQSKACSVSLSAAALTSITVKLSTSDSALQVPASVTIAVGQSSAAFNAVATGVSKTVTVTITGSSGGVTKTDAITLYPQPAATPTLSKVSCASQSLTGPITTSCFVSLSSAAATSTVVNLSSSGSALQVPSTATVSAGAATATFDATASAVSATQNITLTASSGGASQTYSIQLVGTGGQTTQQHKVQLDWNAPGSSTSTIAGYNVYRATLGVSSYALLTSSLDTQMTYTDAGVLSGSTYNYVVTSVDSTGIESIPSASTQVTIP
jgi:hypothetical protein